MTEDEMVGWHHWLDGCEFEQASGVHGGQGSLACNPWGHRKLDTTRGLNNSISCFMLCTESSLRHQIKRVFGFIPAKVKCILQH